MVSPALHYYYDPLCGWCYGTAPLIAIAASLPGVALHLHAGGMLAGDQRRPISPAWRDYVLPHDQRIAELSGQPFGIGYSDGLLRDSTAMLDSAPPISAILAAESAAGMGLAMLHRLQQAYYIAGQQIADPAVLHQLAIDLGLDAQAYAKAYEKLQGAETASHIASSRAQMAQLGARGFPTLVLLDGAQQEILPLDRYLGKPAAWQAWLRDRLVKAGNASQPPQQLACDTASCTV
ncbi:DsbA family protein [Chitinimonas prasina]|uniref:DsbA family protein n=1 Tax=Chitinimonas prasina TaxID=1434937 RepID=A0ABQ5YNW2_9NEIS|nr:DsbA family protein [Chitinimonas prasina]GLR15368.1 DsbA family protein [Chitinimonas prasina]